MVTTVSRSRLEELSVDHIDSGVALFGDGEPSGSIESGDFSSINPFTPYYAIEISH